MWSRSRMENQKQNLASSAPSSAHSQDPTPAPALEPNQGPLPIKTLPNLAPRIPQMADVVHVQIAEGASPTPDMILSSSTEERARAHVEENGRESESYLGA